MSPTLSDIYSEESIVKEVFNCIPNLLGAGDETAPRSTEVLINQHRESFNNLQKFLKKLSPDLSNERRIDVVQNDEVVLFCANESIIKYLGIIGNLVKKHFPTVCKISFAVEYDPETSDKWVSADIKVSGEIDQIIKWEDNFIKEWVASVPYPERDKFRLSYDII